MLPIQQRETWTQTHTHTRITSSSCILISTRHSIYRELCVTRAVRIMHLISTRGVHKTMPTPTSQHSNGSGQSSLPLAERNGSLSSLSSFDHCMKRQERDQGEEEKNKSHEWMKLFTRLISVLMICKSSIWKVWQM